MAGIEVDKKEISFGVKQGVQGDDLDQTDVDIGTSKDYRDLEIFIEGCLNVDIKKDKVLMVFSVLPN